MTMDGTQLEKSCVFCCEPCENVCAHCKLVHYCSEAHLLIHRPKSFCFPFRVDSSDSVGRYVVASRNIEPTEMILYDSPAVKGPKSPTAVVCLGCLKTVDGLTSCLKCRWPMCSSQCSMGETHQRECAVLAATLKKIDFEKTENFRGIAPLRLLLNQKHEPSLNDRLKYLMDHNIERKQNDVAWKNIQDFNEVFRRNFQLEDQFSESEFERAVGVLGTNAFECCQGGGQALFPTISLLSHSCLANAWIQSAPSTGPDAKDQLVLLAKVPIKSGDEITISYTSVMQGKLRRRTKLRDKWYFVCSCLRCLDPTENGSHCSTLICQSAVGNSTCGGNVVQEDTSNVEADLVCQSCQAISSHEKTIQIVNELSEDLRNCTIKDDLECGGLVEQTLERMSQFVHPNHYLNMVAKRHLVLIGGQNLFEQSIEHLQRRKMLCQEILEVLNQIEPGVTQERGRMLCHLAETSKMLSKKLFSQQKISDVTFSEMVQESMNWFQEYQHCLMLSVRKEDFN